MPGCEVPDSWKVTGAGGKQRGLRAWRAATAACAKGAPSFLLYVPVCSSEKKKEKKKGYVLQT